MFCPCPILLTFFTFSHIFCRGLWCDSPDISKILIVIEKVLRLDLKFEKGLLQNIFFKGDGRTNDTLR